MALLIGTACQHSYQEKHLTTSSKPSIRSDSRIFIAVPADYKTKKGDVTQAAPLTVTALRDAFGRYSKAVFAARKTASFEDNLAVARANRCAYMVVPEVTRWEDHDTEWSGRRDRIGITLRIYEVTAGALLDEAVLEGTSRWFTEGGDKPQDLLNDPIGKYVASLFHLTYVPSGLKFNSF